MKRITKVTCFAVLLAVQVFGFHRDIYAMDHESSSVHYSKYAIQQFDKICNDYLLSNCSKKEFISSHSNVRSITEELITGERKNALVNLSSSDSRLSNDDICLIHTIIYTNNPDVTMHIMEGTAKDSKGSTTKHGVTLSGTIHWIDYKGINNTLTGVAGHREGKRTGTMTYEYGVGNSCIGSGSSTSGDFSKHISSDNNGFSFYLTINSPSTSGNTATLTVKTSIFD